jgi:hypothetical protein
MFGIAMAMRTFVSDSGEQAKDFCFVMFLVSRLQHKATWQQGSKKVSLRSSTLASGCPARTLQDFLKALGAIMTSISATSGTSYQSPLQKLQDQLQSEVNSGAISSSDQSALSSALNDIDSSVQSGQAGASSGSASSSPGDLKSKIDSLIANEVSSGKLTSDQATELQGVFKQAFAQGAADPEGTGGPGGPGGTGGPGGAGSAHHGHHGGHGGPPPADAPSSTDGTSSTSSANDILQQFLQSLQSSLSSSSTSSYSATGNSNPGSSSPSFSALLINYQT